MASSGIPTTSMTRHSVVKVATLEEVANDVLRMATRIVLAGTTGTAPRGVQWPDTGSVAEAGQYVDSLLGSAQWQVPGAGQEAGRLFFEWWSRPGPSLVLVKAIAVGLRRAADPQVTAEERLAYNRFSRYVLHSLQLLADSVGPEGGWLFPKLERAALAIIRSGALQCMSRQLASITAAAAAAAAGEVQQQQRQPADSAATASQPGAGAGDTPEDTPEAHVECILAASYFVITTVHRICKALDESSGAGSAAAAAADDDDDAGGGGGGQGVPNTSNSRRLLRELVDALADSQLLEHAAKALFAVFTTGPPPDIFHHITAALRFLSSPRSRRPLLRARGLMGQCLHFVHTAAALEALREIDGGGPTYGLPAEALQVVRKIKVLRPTGESRCSPHATLHFWALTQTPGAGLPVHSCTSPAAMYQLCLRLSAASIGSLQTRDGDGDGSGSSAGGGGGGGADASGSRKRLARCWTAVAALLSAHDALKQQWSQRQQQQQQSPQRQQLQHCDSPGSGVSSSAAEAEGPPAAVPGRVPLVLPDSWWRASVGVVNAAAGCSNLKKSADADTEIWNDLGTLLRAQMAGGQQAVQMPVDLPASPPPDVAAALSAGYLPCLERLLRRQGWLPANALCLLSWRHLGWMLAYGDPRQAAALVETLCKVAPPLQAKARGETTQSQSMVRKLVRLLLDGMHWVRMRQEAGSRAGDDVGAQCSGSSSGSSRDGSSSSSSGSAGAGGDTCSTPTSQLLHILAFALIRWFPICLTELISQQLTLILKATDVVPEANAAEEWKERGETWPPARDALRLLNGMLDWMAGSCSAPGAAHQPQEEAAAWQQLFFSRASLFKFLFCLAGYVDADWVPAAKVAPGFARVLRRLWAHSPDLLVRLLRYREADVGSSSCGVLRGLMKLYGPGGVLPDPQLVEMLLAVWDGREREVAAVLPVVPQQLPPLREVCSLLRVCDYGTCDNLEGDSQLVVELQPRSVGGQQMWFCCPACAEKHGGQAGAEEPGAVKTRGQKQGGQGGGGKSGGARRGKRR
ncbi:hypothetical protein Agub_g5635 [Astrephomene gubernaculifera]|uniref:phytol kinase n=1 Tax=Astrephomene gubernaculifera TaxID=47775 RepID=A0AAD3HKU7_9CHLO|nr:hypothetical protein Agub_g5635 [Astrephomene gubernaculifera]